MLFDFGNLPQPSLFSEYNVISALFVYSDKNFLGG